ncbi:N-acetyl-D-Glu racemase DgcA [Acuticoccus sp. I52.16.1]|uniref:N-acetyl-D-Glu racemase DgcA n=1 Tax=Acuticoccus sp. I52.16.1 TaxID=2928472 RepID=UPI001FD4D480|nr:N-acetyl-D-Glu racemase DgcA [Acuticoccus sp. I52.16.1]UOM34725.1 dipeptide epimerase [Acuticoccus sp. I52.16.1]
MTALTAVAEEYPIAGVFSISRERRTIARMVVATLTDGPHVGRGEAVPYPRYGESVEGVLADILAMSDRIAAGLTREELQAAMPAGAARNAIDLAMWDLEAKRSGTRVADMLGQTMAPVTTAYTIGLGEAEEMAEAARNAGDRPLLKIKLGRPLGDDVRIQAIRAAVPNATLIVDANEGWSDNNLLINMSACKAAKVALIEQPLPANRDGALATVSHPVPICADESVHASTDLAALKGRYDAVNIKLDKTGGLTEALKAVEEARRLDLMVMVGCMVTTSLGIAPAMLLTQGAAYVDIDGPLMLARDRDEGLTFDGSTVYPPSAELWG